MDDEIDNQESNTNDGLGEEYFDAQTPMDNNENTDLKANEDASDSDEDSHCGDFVLETRTMVHVPTSAFEMDDRAASDSSESSVNVHAQTCVSSRMSTNALPTGQGLPWTMVQGNQAWTQPCRPTRPNEIRFAATAPIERLAWTLWK